MKKLVIYLLFLLLGVITPELINKAFFYLPQEFMKFDLAVLFQKIVLYTRDGVLLLVLLVFVSYLSIIVYKTSKAELSSLGCSLLVTLPSFVFGCLMVGDGVYNIFTNWPEIKLEVILQLLVDCIYIIWLPCMLFTFTKLSKK